MERGEVAHATREVQGRQSEQEERKARGSEEEGRIEKRRARGNFANL